MCLCGYFLPNMTRLNRCDERQRGNYTPKRPYAPHFCLFFAHFRPKQCLLSVCLLGNPFIPTSHALGERCLHLCSVCYEKCAPYPPDYGNPATFYRHPRNRDTMAHKNRTVVHVHLADESTYSTSCAAPAFNPAELCDTELCAIRDRVMVTEGWLDGTYVQQPYPTRESWHKNPVFQKD